MHPIIGTDTFLEPYVNSCIFDICMMTQSGANALEIDRWVTETAMLLQQTKIIRAKTEVWWMPNLEPILTGHCTNGSRWKPDCNWCSCDGEGRARCTLIACPPDYYPELGEISCEIGSRWKDGCALCECLNGGQVCHYDHCDLSTDLPTPSITLPTPPSTPDIPGGVDCVAISEPHYWRIECNLCKCSSGMADCTKVHCTPGK